MKGVVGVHVVRQINCARRGGKWPELKVKRIYIPETSSDRNAIYLIDDPILKKKNLNILNIYNLEKFLLTFSVNCP